MLGGAIWATGKIADYGKLHSVILHCNRLYIGCAKVLWWLLQILANYNFIERFEHECAVILWIW